MGDNFKEFSNLYKELLESNLRAEMLSLETPQMLKDAMIYSLEAGGKRIRPLLLFATLAAFNKDPKIGLETASAIEMVHTYSLIHDDLPSMDDDDLRRGKPTNHKVYGEATAILAGDALLTYSFQLITAIQSQETSAATKLAIVSEFAKAAGAEGMVGGQIADMQGEAKQLNLEELQYIHVHKTGKLLAFSVIAGALLAEANNHIIDKLKAFSYHLGLAFQIRDDILDLEGTEELIGKPVGSDEDNHKSTYPSILSMDGAKKALKDHINAAKGYLHETGLKTAYLEEITDLIAVRDN